MTATETPADDSLELQLAARLESGLAKQAMALAEATRRTTPISPARSAAAGPGAFVALGPDRYVNRAIGFGLCEAESLRQGSASGAGILLEIRCPAGQIG